MRIALLRCCALLGLFAGASPAIAAPPPVGSDDWNVMSPYKEWVTTQEDGIGRACCGLGDGRPVEAEIRGEHWWAHIDPKHWDGNIAQYARPGPATVAPEPLKDRWVQIPDEKITRSGNPTGMAILWLYQGRVQCFAPTGGV